MKRNLQNYFWAALLCAAGITTVQAQTTLFFSVNMSTNLVNGTFNPPTPVIIGGNSYGGTGTGVVDVRGGFNGWSALPLVQQGTSAIWTNSAVDSTNGVTFDYKFYLNGSAETTACYDNRTAMLPATSGASLVLPTHYFNDIGPGITINVKFQVDMSEEIALGNFNPSIGDSVVVEGSFNGWSLSAGAQWVLTNDPSILVTNNNFTPPVVESNVYTMTAPITQCSAHAGLPATNASQDFKYAEMPGGYLESSSSANSNTNGNRWLTETGDQILPLVSFSDRTYAPLAGKTLTWQGTSSTAWATAANWYDEGLPGTSTTAPTSADIVTINGSRGATVQPSVTTAGQAAKRLVVGNGFTLTITNSTATLVVGDGSSTIRNDIQIQSGGIINNSGTAATAPLSLLASTDKLRIDNGGTYINNATFSFATPFPVGQSDFQPNSTVQFGQNAGTAVSMSGRTYGNVTLTATSAKAYTTAAGGTPAFINGTLTIGSSLVTLTCDGATNTINNVVVTGGTLALSATTAGTYTFTGNIVNNGTVTLPASAKSIVFNGTSTISGNQITFANGLTVNASKSVTLLQGIIIPTGKAATNNGTLNCGTSIVSGAGTFTLASGATLGIGSPAGIVSSLADTTDGNITTTTARNFNTGANYIYNGTAAQTTGTGLPATINNLTINNSLPVTSGGVTLTANVTVNGQLGLTAGRLITGANQVIIPDAGIISPSGGAGVSYVDGTLQKIWSSTGTKSFTFPIGTGATFAPCGVASMVLTAAGNLTASTVSSESVNIGSSAIDSTRDANRTWTMTPGGGLTPSSYNATCTFDNGDLDGGATSANFVMGNWNGSSWTPATSSSVSGNKVTGNGFISSFGDFVVGDTAPVLTYTAGANGTISGTTPQKVNYNASGTAITAVPNTGYHFVQWSDGVLTASRTDTSVTANLSVTATFAINAYTLTYAAGANGTISGTTPQTVNYNASGTAVTAVPNPGYHFVQWSDGVLTASRTDSSVTANISVMATFAINTYSLTYSAGANGTISGTTPQTVNYNASGTAVTAVPNPGYSFVQWSDGVLTASRTDSGGTANLNVTATFAINTYTLTYDGNGNDGGTAPVDGSDPYNYNTTVTVLGAGTLTKTGYTFAGWNTAADGSGTSYSATQTFSISGNVTLYAQWSCTAPAIVGGINPNSTSLCAGSSLVLTLTNVTGTAPLFYQWQTNGVDILNATNVSYTNLSVTLADMTNYVCVVTNNCGSVTSLVTTVTVNPLPTVSVDSTTICAGDSAILTATTGASSPSYLWNDPANSTTASITVSPSATTTYTVTVTDGTTGCVNSGSGTVTVNPLPTVSVNSETVCAGGSATLTATTSASSPTYLWNDPANSTTPSITVSPGSTTIYTVTVTDGVTGCVNSGSGTVTVNPLPTVSVNSETVCAGGSATLTATTSASNPTYLWSDSETTASITVSPASTTTYTVTVTDGTTGCANSGSSTVTANSVAANDVTYNATIGYSFNVAGTNLLGNASGTGGVTLIAVQSPSASGITVSNVAGQIFYFANVTNTDTFTYTVASVAGGCTATGTVTLNPIHPVGSAKIGNPSNGVVTIQFFGIPGTNYVVETATNIIFVPNWPLSTNTAGSDGSWLFTDLNATNQQQYYRSTWKP